MKYKITIHAIVESPSAAQVGTDAANIQKLLDQSLLKMLLKGQGVVLLEAKIDPTKIVPA
jgi:uncharacterized protein (AIM24 family)